MTLSGSNIDSFRDKLDMGIFNDMNFKAFDDTII